jgi:tetratricopeptide (TPR) repeat protein
MTSQESGSQSRDRQRREPSLGRFDELKFAKPADRAARATLAQRVASWDWRWILAVLLLVVVLLLVLRQPLANWLWPQTRAERLHERAARALVEGRLTSADGTGARELYSAALALDPDRADARAGLDRVGQAALAQARAAISRRQFPQAHEALQLAEELTVPRAQVDALREQLRRNEAASVGIDELLKGAAAARVAGKLEGGDGALPLYQRVLELEPDNTQALEGREDTLSDLLQQARSRLDAGDLAGASVVVRRVQQADPGHVELPDALAALARAAENKRRQADRELRRGQLARALENYGAALLVNPEDTEALNGVQAVATAHARRSERHAADYRFNEAESELRQARSIAGTSAAQNPAIAQAQEHLARARQSQRRSSTAAPTASQRMRVAQLLADATQAQARGDLLTPPGDSAFDKLRAARAIAPHDPRVHAASARLVPAAAQCFSDALRANRLVRAGGCLDARRALEGETATVRENRRELARRWLALGDQRLGAGELQGARAALDAARALDPATDGLEAFAERLRIALLAPAGQGRQ